MNSLKRTNSTSFGMAVHNFTIGEISCSKYSDTENYPKKQHKANVTESGGKRTLPLSRTNGMFSRMKTRQSIYFPARRRAPVHLPKQDDSSVQKENITEKESVLPASLENIRPSDITTCNVRKANSQMDKQASSVPLSPRESTSNMMTTTTSESRASQYSRSADSYYMYVQKQKLGFTTSPVSSNCFMKRASPFSHSSNLNKRKCIFPDVNDDKENQSHYIVDYLDKEGFSNLGNTCYMNADLQALFYSKTFSDEMLAIFNEIKDDLNEDGFFRAICNLLIERNKSVSLHSDDHYKSLLMQIKEAIDSSCKNFLGNYMQDAQEFHNKIVCTMKEELSAAIEKSDKFDLINPVENNFKMTLVETMTCLKCGSVVRKSQEAYDIALQIPSTPDSSLDMALKTNFAEELRDFNCLKCLHNKSKVKTTISCLPRMLAIFLKRYHFTDGQVVKDETFTDVPDLLTLQEFLEKPEPVQLEAKCRSKELINCNVATPSVDQDFEMGEHDHKENLVGDGASTKGLLHSFELTSAICHQGDANSGHYVCYGVDNSEQSYTLFDDTSVSKVSKDAVSLALKEHGYVFIYTKK